jgi:ATP citrate (pro-S)-lyase
MLYNYYFHCYPSPKIIKVCVCDAGEEPCYAGVPMSTIIERGYGVGDVISLLWFKRSLPRYCTQFIEVMYGQTVG